MITEKKKESVRKYYRKYMEEKKEYRRRYYKEHTEEERAYKHRYYLEHKEETRERDRKHELVYPGDMKRRANKSRKLLKEQVLTHYGGGKLACIKCGFTDERALTIDHIDGNGNQHRKEVKRQNLYRWLRRADYPEGFQTLCMNCQWIKRMENREYGGARCRVLYYVEPPPS